MFTGVGNTPVSILEDIISTVLAIAAIVIPVAIAIFMVLLWLAGKYLFDFEKVAKYYIGQFSDTFTLVLFFVSLWQSSVARCDGGPCLNGSLAYGPALIVLLLIGGILLVRGHAAGPGLLAAGLVFAVSLTFRTLDRDICASTTILSDTPLGTHFMWHVLNATLLYILARTAVRHGRSSAASGG